MRSGASWNSASAAWPLGAALGSNVLGERSDREGAVIAHKGNEGRDLPQILHQIGGEALQLVIHLAIDGKHDELNDANRKKHKKSDISEKSVSESIEQPDSRERRMRGAGLRRDDVGAVGGMAVGHGNLRARFNPATLLTYSPRAPVQARHGIK